MNQFCKGGDHMKKFITFTLGVLLTVFCFTACSQEREMEYIALEVGGYDHALLAGLNHSSDIELTVENTVEEHLVGTTKTFTYNGTDYEAVYNRSKIRNLANSSMCVYTYKADKIWIDFGENINSGRLDFYYCTDHTDSSKNTHQSSKSKEECLQISMSYLGEYIDDPDAYEVDYVSEFKLPAGLTYDFHLYRMVSGIPTADHATISITEYGEIISHRFRSLGEFKGFSLPAQDQVQKIQNAFDSKLASIYSPAKESYNYSHELESQELMKLEDGRYLLQQTYRTTLTRVDNAESKSYDTTVLVVPLTK
jgi:hypothetical protein